MSLRFHVCAGKSCAKRFIEFSLTPRVIDLNVPAGTPLPVVLDKEIRIKTTGQEIDGKIAEPVYVFDKLVVPAGSDVIGKITAIGNVPALKRTYAALEFRFLSRSRRGNYVCTDTPAGWSRDSSAHASLPRAAGSFGFLDGRRTSK